MYENLLYYITYYITKKHYKLMNMEIICSSKKYTTISIICVLELRVKYELFQLIF